MGDHGIGAYYNEIDPFAAAWLRELIKAGLIADGEVDERSIAEVTADDVRGFVQCHFFAGIGGWSYALRLAGWPDDRAVWTGSCPCQPFSEVGPRTGFSDARDLWPTWFRLIAERRPVVVFGEQVARRAGLEWLDRVQDDVESISYAFGAATLPACCATAPHKRERVWFVALGNPESLGRGKGVSPEYSPAFIGSEARQPTWAAPIVSGADGSRRRVEPSSFTLAHGLSARVGRLRGYGNAIVPQVAAAFIEAYMSIE
jgi:DNA (cytosine-5)-methyltransferase 1